MAFEQSILKSVKKNLGLDAAYTAFDHDVTTYINSSFFTLNQLGIGPPEGFVIDGETSFWADFTDDKLNIAAMGALVSYISLKVRIFFDPPGTPHHLKALQDQIQELEHRLLMERALIQ